MNIGYLFLLMALLGYSMLGIFHKMADARNCRPRPITLLLFFWGGVLSSLYVLARSTPSGVPGGVVFLALIFGTFACSAILAFQAGLRYGKIATSWLLINLSMVVPALLSVLIYREPVTPPKIIAVVLIFASMFLLWKDKKLENRRHLAGESDSDLDGRGPEEERIRTRKWLQLMLLAFLMNGLGAFGLRILVGEGQSSFTMEYIALWYWAGFLVILASYVKRDSLPKLREIGIAGVMGLCSVVGTVGLALSLDYGVPGFIVYPVSIGGGLFIVVLAGVLLFHENVTKVGVGGILLGIAALVVLALS